MPARQLHLVRHGEVHNPQRVLYGRLPGFGLSDRGHEMARVSAEYVHGLDRLIAAIYSSPLQRTQESAAPLIALSGHNLELDDRLIEPFNAFEGMRLRGKDGALRDVRNWPLLRNPLRPSWGEPFVEIAQRMNRVMDEVAAIADQQEREGDIVLVSHQLPIWITHRNAVRERLAHDPRKRRCALSSVTTFENHGARWVEVAYADPAAALGAQAVDLGAV